MQYPESFKDRVLNTIGYSEELKKSLDEGQDSIGEMLNDFANRGFSAEEVYSAVEANNLSLLYKRAEAQIVSKKLYQEWLMMQNKENQNSDSDRVNYSQLSDEEKRFYDSYWNNDQDFHSEIQPENYEGMSPDYGYDFLDHTR